MIINQNNFKEGVIDSSRPSLVDFYAEWCSPCKAISPMIEGLKQEYDGKINVFKIDVDLNPELANQFDIRSVPTLIFFKNGNIVNTIKGSASKTKLIENLNLLI